MSEIMEITLHRLSKENTNSREKFIFVRFTRNFELSEISFLLGRGKNFFAQNGIPRIPP